MSSLPRINPQKPIILTLEPLTPSSFAPFGTVITSPIPQDLTAIPSSPPKAIHQTHQPNPQFANQKTALKTSPISPLINNYPANTSTPGTGLMSIFSCFPRRLTTNKPTNDNGKEPTLSIPIPILERHPYTTQTFCPFNFSLSSSSSSTSTSTSTSTTSNPQSTSNSNSTSQTYFLVIVAPTTPSGTSDSNPTNPPNLSGLRAFYSPIALNTNTNTNAQSLPSVSAVTYNAATWHAPMIVIGSRRIDFLVTQFANGIGQDDCQEVLIGNPENDLNSVVVDLSVLDLGVGNGNGNGNISSSSSSSSSSSVVKAKL